MRFEWIRRGWCRYLTLGILLLPVSLAAQEPADEPADEKDPVSNNTELALVQTTGNSDSFTFSFKDKFVRRWERSSIELDALALRAENTNRILTNEGGEAVESSQKEVTGDQYGLALSYNHDISERVGWFSLGKWERNRPSGINNRSALDGGLSYLFYDNKVHKLTGQLGLGYTNEEPVGAPSESYPTARAYSAYRRALSETASFDTQIGLIQNLDNGDDLRINFLIGVTAKMAEKLALRVSYTVNFDNDPVQQVVPGDDPGEPDTIFGFDKTDTILAASLVIDF